MLWKLGVWVVQMASKVNYLIIFFILVKVSHTAISH